MAQYRKKPVVIEAIQWQGKGDNNRVMNWLAQQKANVEGWVFHDTEITIPTLEDGADGRAKHVASPGDWIIRGVAGEFYPCKPEIFAATYEAVPR
ncbi:MAG: hypothetical protein E5V54_11275 [Mesorhizobium sp.]|nr:MAG: hypothetical protein E5V54_11275 [Mesorhizobium sp.]